MGLADDCNECFGSDDLFKIFEIEQKATEKAIKKAYYKLSLKYHPDKCSLAEKDENTKKFQVLSKIHQILSDKGKREAYIETGEIDDEVDTLDEDSDWIQYWRNLHPKITTKMIENFTKKYQKSAEEKTDLLAMYTKYKGDMDKIMESVPCGTITDEPRFSEIIHDAIKTKEVKSYKAFTNEKPAKTQARHGAAKDEAEEAEQHAQDLGLNDMGDLQSMILQRQRDRQQDVISRLEAKYSQPKAKKRKTKKT